MNYFGRFFFWLVMLWLIDASSGRRHSLDSHNNHWNNSESSTMDPDVVLPSLYYRSHKESRIIHGKQVQPGEWPAMAAILYSRVAGQIWCGGMVLNDDSIVTAAHCLKGSPNKYIVYLGHVDIATIDKNYKFAIKAFHRFPQYDAKVVANDIGIIKLKSKIKFDKLKGVRRGCVPSSKDNKDVDTQNCKVLGWGQTDQGHVSGKLMELAVPVLNSTICEKYVGTIYNSNQMLCAGYVNKGKGTCYGDSGSPMFCPLKSNHNLNTLVGVTSYGLKCKDGNLPSYFSRVTNYLDFIRKHAAE